METLDLSRYWVEEINIHLVTWGLSGALVFGHAVWLRHPHSLDRILPTLARIFIPLFVLMEAGFLSVQLWAGFDELSSNREQLFVFNLLLAAVIGLVLLHSAFDEGAPRWTHRLMVALVVLGALADLVGIAAIGSRLGAWGVTPNRLTVLVGNLLFLTTLVALLVAWFRGKSSDSSPHVATRRVLNRALAGFVIWAFCVTLLFPLYFGLQVKAEDLSHFEQDLVETLEVE
jgi:predicted ferric reductase